MRLFYTLFFILISNFLYAEDISIIELHETKTLDQLVLETNSEKIDIKKDNSENDSEENLKEESNIEEKEESNIEEENSIVENEEVIIETSNFWENIDSSNLNIYFKNIDSIQSPTLYNEFIQLLTDFNLDIDNPKK